MSRRSRFHRATAALICLALAGCDHSPSFNVLGSYFPGWIACIGVGALLAVFVRLLLRRFRLERSLPMPPLFYFSLALLIACVFWLFSFD